MFSFKNATASLFLLLALSSNASPLAERDVTHNVQFDDISNGFPIQSQYNQANWPGFIVSSPDRSSGDPYVAYASEFQYARVMAGTQGKIQRYSSTAPYLLLKSLRFGCSEPDMDAINPGTPKACKITIKENCANKAHSRTLTVKYTPSGMASPMGSLNLGKGQKCKKAVSYSFQANNADVLLDNVTYREIDVVA